MELKMDMTKTLEKKGFSCEQVTDLLGGRSIVSSKGSSGDPAYFTWLSGSRLITQDEYGAYAPSVEYL